MDKKQFTEFIIVPTLKETPNGYSKEAVKAIQMIVAHESSRGEYLAQTRGPALGVIQMEPATHADVWANGDSIWNNALLLGIISQEEFNNKIRPQAKRLIYDLRYNVFMARQKLFMVPASIPTEAKLIAHYLKKHWNGPGKATPEKYHIDYTNWS